MHYLSVFKKEVPMADINNLDAMKALDTQHVLESIEGLGKQCTHAWTDASKIVFPQNYKQTTSIVFSGMGGSALGAYAIKSLYADTLPVPFDIYNDYKLPPYVNDRTLVMVASYSGTTEETIASARDALSKNACLTGLTTGGTLGRMFTEKTIPYYQITPTYNPSQQPRMATGYSVVGQLAILTTLGFLSVQEKEIQSIEETLTKNARLYGPGVPEADNPAKQLAKKCDGKIPVIVSAEGLGNVGRLVQNYFHETGKNYADYHIIPEMNHHLMEGLTNPKTNPENLMFLFLSSPLYSERIKKRFSVTKDVIQKQHIPVEEFIPTSTSALIGAFECVQFAGYVNYYMAMMYDLDPSKIPWVDYFKKELAK